LQGPHHSAKKSINTGLSELMMVEKFERVVDI